MTEQFSNAEVVAEKSRRRVAARALRASLNEDDRARFAYRAARALIESDVFQRAQVIALYASMGDEAETINLEDAAGDRVILYPRVDGRHLEFRRARRRELEESAFGIPEPTAHHVFFEVAKADLVVVPGLAFALDGHRLGYGRGYYDRALRRMGALAHPNPPRSVGLGFEIQVVQTLPTTPADEPVSALVTEAGLRFVDHARRPTVD
ncbi:MAG: 5-formyltetrahydrofolate cyclo-ligase [Deltaproteobacteria bacterium]|nr:5-formyltetrahydrofolate cyclo-ligase [Deltaproteobacteria bacterium]